MHQVVFSSQQTYELMHCVEHIGLDRRLQMAEGKDMKNKQEQSEVSHCSLINDSSQELCANGG